MKARPGAGVPWLCRGGTWAWAAAHGAWQSCQGHLAQELFGEQEGRGVATPWPLHCPASQALQPPSRHASPCTFPSAASWSCQAFVYTVSSPGYALSLIFSPLLIKALAVVCLELQSVADQAFSKHEPSPSRTRDSERLAWQKLRPHPGPAKSETLGMGISVLTSPLGDLRSTGMDDVKPHCRPWRAGPSHWLLCESSGPN